MTIALHVHNVQTIHNVQRDSKLCKLILTEDNHVSTLYRSRDINTSARDCL